jgi:acetolactate synthase-1/2/3 large subunit
VAWDFELRGYHPERRLNTAQIDRVMEAIGKARKPMLYIGQGIVLGGACDELREFAEKTGIPVATTLLSAGAFPASHELNAGPLGMHGAAHTNYAIHEADLVVCLGARFDDRVTGNPKEFAKQAQFIHVDLDPSEINKNVAVQIPVAADVKEALAAMLTRAKDGHLEEWRGRIEELKKKYPMHYKPGSGEIKPQYVVERLSDMTSGKAVVTTGVGQHQMWTWQYYKFEKPRHFITSGGAGTMGFGLPSAIGAQFGRPGELVIDVDGDGSFEMNINDMRTVADNNLPIKVVILNNHMLGMVGQWQRQFFKGKYSSSEFSQDFPNFTAGCRDLYGIPGKRIKRREEVVPALEEMLKSKEPYILDCQIPKEENVYPMIPAGGTIKDIILQEEQGDTPPV